METQSVLAKLKADGHRITAARSAVVALFEGACNPLSAQEAHAKLTKKGLKANLTTVYRELQFLVDQQIARTVQFEDGVLRYEAAHDHHHHHLVCLKCASVQEVHAEEDLEKMERAIGKKTGFTVVRHSLEFYGYCRKCG